jgi:integrase
MPKAREGAKLKFTPLFVSRKALEPGLFWDTEQKGLALRVEPSGHRSYKTIYSFHGRPRWYTIGDAKAIDLSVARKQARLVMNAVAEGRDPAAERKAERAAGTFEELAARYVEEHAKKHNKSWRQGEALVRRYCLPRWAKLKPGDITRADVKALMGKIEAPTLANQVLAAASAIFSWAIKQEVIPTNPCQLIDRNATRSRERVLSERELPLFWAAFDNAGVPGMALKLILLTGQRPGEITRMRHEHIEGGWWTLPGEPIEALGWPGTKNGATHRLWIPEPAQKLIATNDGEGFVLPGPPARLDDTMRSICTDLGITDRVKPHDLRRSHGTMITGLGFGRAAMNRIQNHREGGIGDVYDRYDYSSQNKTVMETVATRIMALVEGRSESRGLCEVAPDESSNARPANAEPQRTRAPSRG